MQLQNVNKLRDLLASGALSSEDVSNMSQAGGYSQGDVENMLSRVLSQPSDSQPLPMGSMRNESTGKMIYFQPDRNAPRTTADPGFSDTPYPAQAAAQPAPSMRVIGYGNGMATDLGNEASRAMPVDYTRPAIDIPGVGKGHYTADGRSAIVSNPDGSQTKVILGYDAAASDARNARSLAMEAKRADIAQSQAATAHTQEQTAASQDARLLGAKQAPPGYQWTPDRQLRPIPGGPADFKQQGVYNADTATMQSSFADLDRLATSANELLKHPGLQGITGVRGAFPNIPGTQASDADAKLATLKSQVGFGVLQAMRNASKTGGALGNVSDAEGKRLEANLAALDKAQSVEQFQQSLQKIVDFSNGAKDRLSTAYNMKYQPDVPGGGKTRVPAAPGVGMPPSNSQDQSASVGAQSLPDPQFRVVGRSYDTPRGKLMWLGNGWRAP